MPVPAWSASRSSDSIVSAMPSPARNVARLTSTPWSVVRHTLHRSLRGLGFQAVDDALQPGILTLRLNDKLSRGGSMLHRVTTLVVAVAALCSADSLTLRSGRVVHGQYLGGDARQIRMAVGDRVDTFDVAEVSNLQFGGGERQSSDDAGAPPPRR